MALIDNDKLYENIEKKLELIKAAKEQPVIMKPFIKDFAYRFCWSSNALEGNTLSLDETICLIDYDEVRKIALEIKPKMIIAGASAYPRKIDFKKFREIADKVGAYLLVDMAHISGLIGAGVIPSPIPYADFAKSSCSNNMRS